MRGYMLVSTLLFLTSILGCSVSGDDDGDGIRNSADNCPQTANQDQIDIDGDGLGDLCDLLSDTDADQVSDDSDNCPSDYNPDQMASIGNATILGDACDDEDADAIFDEVDNCPLASNSDQADRDGNGVGDACESCVAMSIVADIWPGSGSGAPRELVQFQNTLYFSANDGITGRELWTYDPAIGISQVADIVPGDIGSTPQWITALDGKLYFEAIDAARGSELWVYDPTDRSARVVTAAGFPPGSEFRQFRDFFALSGKLFLSVKDGMNWGLWKYDPEIGTALIVENTGDTHSFRILELDGKLYFFRDNELWVYDLNDPAARILQVLDFNYGFTSASILTTMDGKLYFKANNAARTGYSSALWAYDPANPLAGALMVADIRVTSSGRLPSHYLVLGSKLFFFAFLADGSGPPELWVYDQVAGASAIIDNAWSYPEEIAALDGKIYIARDERHEIWVYDPADPTAGTTLVATAGDGQNEDYWAQRLTAIAGKLYFTGNGDLWMYDPEKGVTLMLDSSGRIQPTEIIELDGKLYFSATDGAHGRELWVHDPACSQ